MISSHSDLRLIPTRGGPQRVVADAQGNLEYNSLHAPRSASLTDARHTGHSLLSTQVILLIPVCCGHGSLHDTSHSSM